MAPPPVPSRLRPMHTIEVTDEELRLAISAVRSYLDDFGHDEADVLRKVKELLRKLEAPQAESSQPG